MSQQRAGGSVQDTTSTASHVGVEDVVAKNGVSVESDILEEPGTVTDEKDSCPCQADIPDEDTFVCCENCQQWWHATCANLKGITGEAIGSLTEWKCPHCFVSPYTKRTVLKSVFPALFDGDIEKPIKEAVQNEVKKVIPGIIKAVIQETVKEKNFKKTFADVVKERQEQFTVQASKTIEKSMDTAIKNNEQNIINKANQKIDTDQFERLKRKRNVVFSGVPESSLSTSSGRLKSDMKKVEKLIQPEEKGLVITCHRAGKKIDGKNRLLIVTMETPDLAEILHGYGSGRKFVAEDRVIWCNPDLIKADRISNYNARKLQREKRAAQEERRGVQVKPAAKEDSQKTTASENSKQVKHVKNSNINTKAGKTENFKRVKFSTLSDNKAIVNSGEGEYNSDSSDVPF